MLYQLYDKRTNKKVGIYGVNNKDDKVEFAIRKHGRFIWVGSEYYLTIEEYQELSDTEKSRDKVNNGFTKCATKCGVCDYNYCCKHCSVLCDDTFKCEYYLKGVPCGKEC